VDKFRIVGFILRLKPQVFSLILYKNVVIKTRVVKNPEAPAGPFQSHPTVDARSAIAYLNTAQTESDGQHRRSGRERLRGVSPLLFGSAFG